MAAIVLDDLVFDVYLVAVPLTHCEQRPMTWRRTILLHTVIASDVSRINTRVIRRLEPAGSRVALGENTIAIRAVHQFSPPRGHAAVPVPQVRLAPSQKLVRQLEVEIITATLLTIKRRLVEMIIIKNVNAVVFQKFLLSSVLRCIKCLWIY